LAAAPKRTSVPGSIETDGQTSWFLLVPGDGHYVAMSEINTH